MYFNFNSTRIALLALVLSVAPAVALAGAPDVVAAPKRDAVVVYPASATSKTPIAVDLRGPDPDVAPPTRETELYDFETPIGQVRNVLKALEELREARRSDRAVLDSILARGDVDALRKDLQAALDARADRIDEALRRIETKLDVAPDRAPDPPTIPTPNATRSDAAPFSLVRLALLALGLVVAYRGLRALVRDLLAPIAKKERE